MFQPEAEVIESQSQSTLEDPEPFLLPPEISMSMSLYTRAMPYKENYLVQSPADDVVIWRYMDLPKFLLMLEQRSLYFALLREFEDKWEAVISRDLSRGIQAVSGSSSGTVIKSFQEVFEHLGINCWYSGTDESIAMWRLYTNSEYGLTIKSTVGHLKQALEGAPAAVLIGQVEYRDHTDAPSETMAPSYVSPFAAVLQKRTCYKHECEIRAITQVFLHCESSSSAGIVDLNTNSQHGIALPVDLPILVRSLTTGPKFPRWADALLASALSRAALNVPIIESNAFKEPEARFLEP
jgi:hypothetical protein